MWNGRRDHGVQKPLGHERRALRDVSGRRIADSSPPYRMTFSWVFQSVCSSTGAQLA